MPGYKIEFSEHGGLIVSDDTSVIELSRSVSRALREFFAMTPEAQLTGVLGPPQTPPLPSAGQTPAQQRALGE